MLPVRSQRDERLNVLLSDGEEAWARHLPNLLEPQGVRAIRVHSVRHAMDVIESEPIHVAVVDLGLPVEPGEMRVDVVRRRPGTEVDATKPGALKLVQVMRRLEPSPPTVIVRGRLFDRRVDDRLLREALTLNVFSVLDQPVDMEQMLQVLRRVLERHYDGGWPT